MFVQDRSTDTDQSVEYYLIYFFFNNFSLTLQNEIEIGQSVATYLGLNGACIYFMHSIYFRLSCSALFN